MAATSPTTLASAIARKAVEAQTAATTLTRLAARLTSETDALTPAYAYDHAEEELLWAAEALEEVARAVRSLTAHTVTGAVRERILDQLIAEAKANLVDAAS